MATKGWKRRLARQAARVRDEPIAIRDEAGTPIVRRGQVTTVYTSSGCDVWCEEERFGSTWFAGEGGHSFQSGQWVRYTLSDKGPGRVETIEPW